MSLAEGKLQLHVHWHRAVCDALKAAIVPPTIPGASEANVLATEKCEDKDSLMKVRSHGQVGVTPAMQPKPLQ